MLFSLACHSSESWNPCLGGLQNTHIAYRIVPQPLVLDAREAWHSMTNKGALYRLASFVMLGKVAIQTLLSLKTGGPFL